MFGKKKKKQKENTQKHPFRPLVVETKKTEKKPENIYERCVSLLDGNERTLSLAEQWLQKNWHVVEEAIYRETLERGNSFCMLPSADLKSPAALTPALVPLVSRRLLKLGFKRAEVDGKFIHIQVK